MGAETCLDETNVRRIDVDAGVHIAAEVRAVGPFPFVASSLSIIGVIDHAIAVDVAEELAQADRSRAYGTALDASDVVCGNHGGRSVTSIGHAGEDDSDVVRVGAVDRDGTNRAAGRTRTAD